VSLAFDAVTGREYAARPYVGGINGISGASLSENANSGSVATKQDYIVIPNQEQLHGISAGPDLVKQFVATPSMSQPTNDNEAKSSRPSILGGNQTKAGDAESPQSEGATIEWQISGEDSADGIQPQIIPRYNTDNMYAGDTENAILPKFSRKSEVFSRGSRSIRRNV